MRRNTSETQFEYQSDSQSRQSQSNTMSVSVDEIHERYNDVYQFRHVHLTRGELRKGLARMNREVLIQKDGKDRWIVKSMKVLKDMINPLHGK